jgi:glutamate 5-kinase
MVRSDKAVSVLPVGITSVDGEFEKDDIIRIVDNNGELIGVGKADCDSEKVRENIGKHGEKAVVHYDYLYIE